MRHRLLLLALAGAVVLAIAPGVASARQVDLTGERIHVLAGEPTEYPANTEFFVLHGLAQDPPGLAGDGTGRHTSGRLFELYVDDVWVEPTFTFTQPWGPWLPGVTSKLWAFNFLEGLEEGDHRFEGLWYLPCALVEGDLVEECDNPNTPVVVIEESLTVHFYEEP